MAINTSTFESTLQNKLDNVTDPKEMLLLGKALESTVGSIAVSDIQTEGATQVAAVQAAGTSVFPSQTGNAGKALVTDGTNISWGTGGRLLKVYYASFPTMVTTTSTSPISTGNTLTITPQSSTSTLLLFYSANGGLNTASQRQSMQILRDGVQVATTSQEITNANSTEDTMTMNVAISSNSTSSTTFDVQFEAQSGTAYINRNQAGSMIIFEVEN